MSETMTQDTCNCGCGKPAEATVGTKEETEPTTGCNCGCGSQAAAG